MDFPKNLCIDNLNNVLPFYRWPCTVAQKYARFLVNVASNFCSWLAEINVALKQTLNLNFDYIADLELIALFWLLVVGTLTVDWLKAEVKGSFFTCCLILTPRVLSEMALSCFYVFKYICIYFRLRQQTSF